MTTGPSRLPGWCEGLLAWIGNAHDREAFGGDLLERLPLVRRRRGPLAASLWLAREALRGLWQLDLAPRLKHIARDAAAGGWWLDVCNAWRRLRAGPGLAAGIIVTLALGIGTNTAVFSVVNHALLNPLPYRGGDRLAYVYQGRETFYFVPTLQLARAWRAASSSIEDLTAYYWMRLLPQDEPGDEQTIQAACVEPAFFDFLGVRPRWGRGLLASDPSTAADAAAVISERLARRLAGGPQQALGRRIRLTQRAFDPASNEVRQTAYGLTVVGVMPAAFSFPGSETDVWIPLGAAAPQTIVTVLARLRPGVTAVQANRDLLAAQTAAGLHRTGIDPLIRFPQDNLGVDAATALWGLQVAVALVLLIACVNVSHLRVGRVRARRREAAVKLALGASRSRLVRGQILESALLAAAGGAAGLVVGAFTLEAFRRYRPDRFLAPLDSTRFDATSCAAGLVLAGVCVLLTGLVPAWRIAAGDPASGLRAGTRAPAGGRLGGAWPRALIAAETALAFVIVVSAALLGRSFVRIIERDPGVAARHVTTFTFHFEGAEFLPAAARWRGLDAILDRVRRLSGVSAASYGIGLPPESGVGQYALAGTEAGQAIPGTEVWLSYVGESYFRTAGTRLVAGRGFTADEVRQSAPVLVINDATGRRLFRSGTGVGRRLDLTGATGRRTTWTVVGVAGNVRPQGLTSDAASVQLYFPYRFDPQIPPIDLIVRGTNTGPDVRSPVRDEIRAVAGGHAVTEVSTIESQLAASLARPRFVALLFAALSLLALVLAALGVYAVISHDIASRRHEIGVRIALGAGRRRVLAWLVGGTGRPVALGLLAGGAAAAVATRYLATLLDDVSPTDPMTFAGVALLFVAVAGLAIVRPARRSSRVDPLDVLRAE